MKAILVLVGGGDGAARKVVEAINALSEGVTVYRYEETEKGVLSAVAHYEYDLVILGASDGIAAADEFAERILMAAQNMPFIAAAQENTDYFTGDAIGFANIDLVMPAQFDLDRLRAAMDK